MEKMFNYLLLFCLLSLTGCYQNNAETNKNENKEVHLDGPALVFIEGKEYVYVRNAEKNEFTIERKIGEVKSKVLPCVIPNTDYSSNALAVGTEIYTVKDVDNIFLAKITENQNYVFELSY